MREAGKNDTHDTVCVCLSDCVCVSACVSACVNEIGLHPVCVFCDDERTTPRQFKGGEEGGMGKE